MILNRRFMKISKSAIHIVYLISTLLISCIGVVRGNCQTVPLSGLSNEVTVKRDGRGIPYISATKDADLYFVQGYITASDRLWQMDLMRRVARGQTAELFGKATLEEDRRWRRFGFSKIADDTLLYLSPELRSALENYSKGVNAYISTLDDKTIPV